MHLFLIALTVFTSLISNSQVNAKALPTTISSLSLGLSRREASICSGSKCERELDGSVLPRADPAAKVPDVPETPHTPGTVDTPADDPVKTEPRPAGAQPKPAVPLEAPSTPHQKNLPNPAVGKPQVDWTKLYNEGEPIYPGFELEKIEEQIIDKKSSISIRGPSSTFTKPMTYNAAEKDTEGSEPPQFSITKPILGYSSIQKLTTQPKDRSNQFSLQPIYITAPIKFSGYRKGMTSADMQSEYTDALETWQRTSSFKNLEESLTDVQAAKPTRLIAFGLGSMHTVTNKGPLMQHAMIKKIADTLGIKDIQAQDPSYTKLDADFLKGKGIKVQEDPTGILYISPHTFVVSIAPDAPIAQIVADADYPPKAIMWDTQINEGSNEDFTETKEADPSSSRVKKLLSSYKSRSFSQEGTQGLIERPLTIYTRDTPASPASDSGSVD